MTSWQPIETAPVDGTHVLLFGTYQWDDYADDQETGIVVGYFDHEWNKRWRATSANPYTDYCQPTHWMPLPEPPHD